jgi:transposase
MNDINAMPLDVNECHRLLWAAYQQTVELEQGLARSQQQLSTSQQQLSTSQQQLAAAQQQVSELNRVLDETAASYAQLQEAHQATREELALYKRWVFGRRGERRKDGEGQQYLFDIGVSAAETVTVAAAEPPSSSPEVPAAARRRRREQRQTDLSKLPHHRHEHDLSPQEKCCAGCGRDKDRIGEDVSTVLEYVPSKLEVHEHVRPKYACRYCKDGVSSPPPPPRPIARGLAGPGLLAQVIVDKYGDHLPLYRQEDIFTRHGLYLARSTLCDWVMDAATLLKPLYDLQKTLVLQSDLLWTDDTTVTLLGDDGSCQGRYWTYIGDDQHPYSVYDFTRSRQRDGPQTFLQTFCGYLHADAYAGYDAIYLGTDTKVIEVACWSHARRKFYDARTSYPRQAHQVLEWIRQLYDIEDRARSLSNEARRALRVAEANPVLDKIEAYLPELAGTLLPKSSLAKAVTYARNQWQALRRYTSDGRLTIDNNLSERTLRHQAIGRKNWLFVGSEKAGEKSAILYTILAGAKRHYLEPWAYVRDLLLRLNGADECLAELLPDRWAAMHPEQILHYRLEESRRKAAAQQARRQHRREQNNAR